ncbi:MULTISPECIES: SDR family oxidoreductase [Acinetobacter]|uniref:SDR family oxidoreductase n=1 Tax=Acinetobacter TaxID=469 RepID=UPI00044D9162|nr:MULTISPECIES: SDR family oxidoreductase [Acinetobacter]EXD35485.1 polysaccharide biosynthesis family protein [Acinetobacter sp. 479375]MCU4358149.1 SDR family oxidoreductase [Acinetobacter ursingii]MEC8057980.1 SDR family oxidoreductase [Pseudomonadota bacterium]
MSKKILITGAGSGFGKSVAFKLAKLGYEVIATVEAVAQIQTLKDEAHQQGLNIQFEKLDITNDIDREFISNFEIDILLNNAGISEGGAVVDIPEYRLREQFEVNVFGTILLTQKFAKQFVERKSGKIIFISSVAGLTTDPFTGAYSASKHAIEAFAEALNKELHEYNVKIATVNPGPILTGFNDRMFETWKHWYPEDQANTVFDYSQLAFPHKQYDPEQVSDIIVRVVTEEQKNYRNLAPKEIEADAKKQMAEKWDRLIHTDAKRDPLVEDAYTLEPETPNGK